MVYLPGAVRPIVRNRGLAARAKRILSRLRRPHSRSCSVCSRAIVALSASIANRSSDTPATIAICFGPVLGRHLPCHQRVKRLLITRGWLSSFIFHNSLMFFAWRG